MEEGVLSYGWLIGDLLLSISAKDNVEFEAALDQCVAALRKTANLELSSKLEDRLCDLNERKEFLSQQEHEQLLLLVDVMHLRSIEKIEAQLALKRLRNILPEVVDRN